MRRPLLRAIEHPGPRPAVLLDRRARPRRRRLRGVPVRAAGRVERDDPRARDDPRRAPAGVVLTSNRTRDLHDALKRRCLYHWIDYPTPEREVEIVRRRVPGTAQALAAEVAAARAPPARRATCRSRRASPRRSTGSRRCELLGRRARWTPAAAERTLGLGAQVPRRPGRRARRAGWSALVGHAEPMDERLSARRRPRWPPRFGPRSCTTRACRCTPERSVRFARALDARAAAAARRALLDRARGASSPAATRSPAFDARVRARLRRPRRPGGPRGDPPRRRSTRHAARRAGGAAGEASRVAAPAAARAAALVGARRGGRARRRGRRASTRCRCRRPAPHERLATKGFAELDARRAARAGAASCAQLSLATPLRRTRRARRAAARRPPRRARDAARAATAPAATRSARCAAAGGAPPRRSSCCCDISGSMEPYARAFLPFLHGAVGGARRRGVRLRHAADAADARAARAAARPRASRAPPRPRPTGRAARASARRCGRSTTATAGAGWRAARSS